MLDDQGLIVSGRSLLIFWRRQRGERQIRQRARRHNDQSFGSELRRRRAEQHSAVRPCLSNKLWIGRSPAFRTHSEQCVNPASGGFEFGAGRKLVAVDGARRNKPEVTAFFAERIFEQQCVFIKRLLLNLREAQRLRLGQSCVSGAASPNLRPDLFIFAGDGGDLFGDGGGLFWSVLTV